MKIKINEICLYGMLGVILFALKFAMSFLPNIEPVSLLLIVYTITFGVKAIYPMTIYILLEILIYGFNLWSVAYLYIWLILVIATLMVIKITNKNMNPLIWASVSGVFGLIFGAMYMPIYMASGGFAFALTWWISGIPFDVIHCVANFILCATLFKPITTALLTLKQEAKL